MKSFGNVSRLGFSAVALFTVIASAAMAHAGELPQIKVDGAHPLPNCATPGRLQAFLAKRNPSLAPHFKSIALDYMREGDALGIRWDIAFFQMMLETGNLSYEHGARIAGVKIEQNNFAGLKPIEKNAHYESFDDVAAGARAHLQHVKLYTGETVDAPVSKRTRRVQEMGMLAQWRKGLSHETTFDDLASKWTDGSSTYADRLKEIADAFDEGFCHAPDPHPELVSSTRATTQVAAADAVPSAAPAAVPGNEKVSGADLARRAIEEGADRRSGLGATTSLGAVPVKIINAPEPDIALPATGASLVPPASQPPQRLPVPQLPKASAQPPAIKTAAVGAAAAKAAAPTVQMPTPQAAPRTPEPPASTQQTLAPATTAPQKCRVFTASYGGQRAVIVKALSDQVANFTVLDVNEGQETREAEAFISAYAKGGTVAGQFASQDKALEKAFELCPEG